MSGPTRRELVMGAAALACSPIAHAFGDTTQVDIAEIDLPGTQSRPNAWKRLLYETIQTTSVECRPQSVRVAPDDHELFQHPFCVLLGSDRFAPPSAEALEQLSRFLSYGGFLLLDDTSGTQESGFDQAARDLVARLYPTRPLAPLATDHSVLRSFFLLREAVGRVDRARFVEGVTVGNLTPLVYFRNDLSGALDRGDDGRPRQPCVPGGETQRREAIKFGINLIMYSLTANYKKDQAHVRELMKQRRLE